MRDDDHCTNCQKTPENIMHFFIECPIARKLWEKLQEYVNDNITSHGELDFSDQVIIFNCLHEQRQHLVNMIVLIAKQYLYRSCYMGTKPLFKNLQNEIILIHRQELYYVKMKNKLDKHFKKWAPLYPEYEENAGNYADAFVLEIKKIKKERCTT